GSDTSSVHSEKDRAASLATSNFIGDSDPPAIPPVPPLPKAYQTPPGSSHQHLVSHPGSGPNTADDPEKTFTVPPIEVQSPPQPTPSVNGAVPAGLEIPVSAPAPPLSSPRTPSKKWSFSGLNLRLPSSGPKDGPLSPRSPKAGKLTS